LLRHSTLSIQALDLIRGIVSSKTVDAVSVDEVVRRIAALEREGDEIMRSLGDAAVQGLVAPTITSTLMLLLDNVDNVLDLAYYLAKEIGRGFKLWVNEGVSAIVRGSVREMLDLDRAALEYLQSLFRTLEVDEAKRLARLISSLEEEIDEVKERALDEAYSREYTAVEFTHVTSLIYSADKIADNVQDAAFHFLTIISSL